MGFDADVSTVATELAVLNFPEPNLRELSKLLVHVASYGAGCPLSGLVLEKIEYGKRKRICRSVAMMLGWEPPDEWPRFSDFLFLLEIPAPEPRVRTVLAALDKMARGGLDLRECIRLVTETENAKAHDTLESIGKFAARRPIREGDGETTASRKVVMVRRYTGNVCWVNRSET